MTKDDAVTVDTEHSAAPTEVPIIEEHLDNRGTGVEQEDQGDQDLARPWDPNKIRVDTRTYSLRNILDMIDEGELELAPDFQRGRVWTSSQKSRLIESVLLRIPLPAFYFSSNDEGRFQVVDGLQRLSTIHDFVRGDRESRAFKLTGLEYLDGQVGGKTFRDLADTLWPRRIHSTQIIVNVVDPQTPDAVKFDIFRRINTGGTPLNQQEIRHCMSGSKSRDFLTHLTDLESFNTATGGMLQGHRRMADREMALRYCAFASLRSLDEYDAFGSMSELLNVTTKRIDREYSDNHLDELVSGFVRAMENASRLFGEFAFRKWPTGVEKKNPISRPLFEVWSVILANTSWDYLEHRRDSIVAQYRQIMADDTAFINSISFSTGNVERVKKRFLTIDSLIRGNELA